MKYSFGRVYYIFTALVLLTQPFRAVDMPSFSRIVRFKSSSGNIFYGEVPGRELTTKETLINKTVAVYSGGLPFDQGFVLTEQKEEIAEACACPAASC